MNEHIKHLVPGTCSLNVSHPYDDDSIHYRCYCIIIFITIIIIITMARSHSPALDPG